MESVKRHKKRKALPIGGAFTIDNYATHNIYVWHSYIYMCEIGLDLSYTAAQSKKRAQAFLRKDIPSIGQRS